jgi:Copper type II ascorbate-dependent monooxygenase, C-terminal domain/Secretion system C-terminal sorting domain
MSLGSFAQNTWSNNIAQLVYDNCTPCHNPKGIGPFSLLNYTNVKPYSARIKKAVTEGIMPPWIVDNDYQDYAHARVLTTTEIDAISDWVTKGSPEGDANKTPPPPVYKTKGFIKLAPDLELKMPVYASKASSRADDYVCFSVPSNLTQDKKIRAFEVIPGNLSIVHHALVYLDATGSYPTDTAAGVCVGPITGLIGAYVPGSPPTIFPSNGNDFNLGFEFKKGSNVVLAMHYPEGSFGEVDSTIVRFWFYDDQISIRELKTEPLVQNWSFVLPPNQLTDVRDSMDDVTIDYSMVSVFAHMHLLGKSIESFAVTPSKDTLPFVKISHWDFDWQEFLFFKNMVKLPKGSVIYSNGTYDNTVNNHHNLGNPPVKVLPGLNTKDEMFLTYFHYLPYVNGDEFRDIQALSKLSTGKLISDILNLEVYPSPANNIIQFNMNLEEPSRIGLRIYNSQGKLVAIVNDAELFNSGEVEIIWQIPRTISNGVYFYSMNVNGNMGRGSLMINR